MGLLNFLSRKKYKNSNDTEINTKGSSFIIGVKERFELNDSNDIIACGNVTGTITVGDAVYCQNIGDDDGEVFLSTILEINIDNKQVTTATDCNVNIRIENGKNIDIKIGTVLYTEDKCYKDVHGEYINIIGDYFVLKRELDLSEEEIKSRSLMDLIEMWRLFSYFHLRAVKNESEQDKLLNQEKINKIAVEVRNKLLNEKEIYCLYSKETGEPYMLADVINEDDSYVCTAINIFVFPKTYKSTMIEHYEGEGFDIQKIENGEDGKGIYNFFFDTFYLNGAGGVNIVSQDIEIDASMIIPKPDYSNIKNSSSVPVENAAVERWLLLMGQITNIDDEDEQFFYSFYYEMLSQEIIKGKFLIPIKKDNNFKYSDEDESAILERDDSIMVSTREGRDGRQSTCLFTDWKRFNMIFGDDWEALVQPISEVIDQFDCEINPTKFIKAGCYISKDTYENMKGKEE